MEKTNPLTPVFSSSEIDSLNVILRIYGAAARIYRAACSICNEFGYPLEALPAGSSAELSKLSPTEAGGPYSVVLSNLYTQCLEVKPKNSRAAECLGELRIREAQKPSIKLLHKGVALAGEMLLALDGPSLLDQDRTRLKTLSAAVIEIATHFEGAHERDEHDNRVLDEIARWLQSRGSGPSQALACARRLISNKGGRPTTGRKFAVRALDLKIARPHLSWKSVAQQVCECGSATHDGCADRLDSALANLRKVLAKHGLDTFKFDAQGRLLVLSRRFPSKEN